MTPTEPKPLKPNIRRIRKLYGKTAALKKVKDLKRGDLLIRSRVGGVIGTPGLFVAEVIGSYPVADGKYFVMAKDGGGDTVHGDRWALISKEDTCRS